jgi:predicted NAD/FAD-dependent oxidoreductase
VWILNENKKPGHVPANKQLLIVQMSEAWTKANYDLAREEIPKKCFLELKNLLKLDQEFTFSKV